MLAHEVPVWDPMAGSPLYRGETKARRKGREQFGVTKEGGSPSPQAAALSGTRTLFPHTLCAFIHLLVCLFPHAARTLSSPGTKVTDEPARTCLPGTLSLTLGVQMVVFRVTGHLPRIPTDTGDSLWGIRPGHPSLGLSLVPE